MARISPSDVERRLRDLEDGAPPPDLLQRLVAEIPPAVPISVAPVPVVVRREGWSVAARRLLAASILVTLTAAGLTWEMRSRFTSPEVIPAASTAQRATPKLEATPGAAEPAIPLPLVAPPPPPPGPGLPKPVPQRSRGAVEPTQPVMAPPVGAPGGAAGGFAPNPLLRDEMRITSGSAVEAKPVEPSGMPNTQTNQLERAPESALLAGRVQQKAAAAPADGPPSASSAKREGFAGAAAPTGSGVETLDGGLPQTLRMKVEDPFGRPLSGVSLLISPRGDSIGGREVATDASGWASTAPISPGDYALHAALPGYLPSETTVAVSEEGAAVRVRLFPQASGAFGTAARPRFAPVPPDRLAGLEMRLAQQGTVAFRELTVANLERALDEAVRTPFDLPVQLEVEGARSSRGDTRWVRVAVRAGSLLPGSKVELRFDPASVEWVRRTDLPAREAVSAEALVLGLRETGGAVAESWLFEVGLRASAPAAEPLAVVTLRTQAGQEGGHKALSAASAEQAVPSSAATLRLAVLAADLATAAQRPTGERALALQAVVAEAQDLVRGSSDGRAERLLRLASRAAAVAAGSH